MSTTVILGGGFGGLACARALRAKTPADHRIVVVDRAPLFFVGATKTWLALGEKSADEITRPRATLLPAQQGRRASPPVSFPPSNLVSLLSPSVLRVAWSPGRIFPSGAFAGSAPHLLRLWWRLLPGHGPAGALARARIRVGSLPPHR